MGAIAVGAPIDAAVTESSFAKPCSKSLPIILSMLMNTDIALVTKLFCPVIDHVTFVPP